MFSYATRELPPPLVEGVCILSLLSHLCGRCRKLTKIYDFLPLANAPLIRKQPQPPLRLPGAQAFGERN